MNEKIRIIDKMKLSPRIEQKFRKEKELKQCSSKNKLHKERLISEKRKRNAKA